MEDNDTFSRIWDAFDSGRILAACAWCGRVQIDDIWLSPSPAALAAIDHRHTLSHSICDECAALVRTHSRTNTQRSDDAIRDTR